jgi:cation-transporting ATPase 13A2
MVDRSLDLLTICVPPALPAAMTCGVVFAIQRLKKQNIYCISPNRVNVAGRVTAFVFDKTGTITEDSLSVMGSRSVTNNSTAEGGVIYKDFTRDMSEYSGEDEWWAK